MEGSEVRKTLQLTKDLVSFPSTSDVSNEEVSQVVADQLVALKFEVEWDDMGRLSANVTRSVLCLDDAKVIDVGTW